MRLGVGLALTQPASMLQRLYGRAAFRLDSRINPSSGVPTDLSVNGLTIQSGSSSGADTNDPQWLPVPSTYEVDRYVYVPPFDGNGLTTVDAPALNITGDLDLRVLCIRRSNGGGAPRLVSKNTSDGATVAYEMYVTTASNALSLLWVDSGGTLQAVAATAALPLDQMLWIRATLDVDNGAGGHAVNFYTSTDGSTWSQFGTPNLNAGAFTTSIRTTTAPLCIGNRGNLNRSHPGEIFRAQVYDGIDGVKVFDWSAEDTVNATHTEFTASTGQTVTVGRATSGRKTVVVEQQKWALGTDDFFEVADNDLLDLDAATDFTVLVVLRQHATPTNYGRIVSKESSNLEGWLIANNGTAQTALGYVGDPADADLVSEVGLTPTAGDLRSIGFRWNRTANLFQAVTNGTVSTGDALTSMGAVETSTPVRIGCVAYGTAAFQDFELYAVYIWREVLTASELATIAADWGVA